MREFNLRALAGPVSVALADKAYKYSTGSQSQWRGGERGTGFPLRLRSGVARVVKSRLHAGDKPFIFIRPSGTHDSLLGYVQF